MTREDGTVEQREDFTDEEFAFLRHVRFGQLPERVLPSDMVELSETEARRDWPDVVVDQRDLGGAGG